MIICKQNYYVGVPIAGSDFRTIKLVSISFYGEDIEITPLTNLRAAGCLPKKLYMSSFQSS